MIRTGRKREFPSIAQLTDGRRCACGQCSARTSIQNADGPGEFRGFFLEPFDDDHFAFAARRASQTFRSWWYRFNGSEGEVSVSYGIARGGTATPGEDFVISGTLAWADGDTAPKFIEVDYLEDAAVEGDESFRIDLIAPTGGATISSSLRRQVMIIIDNDEGFLLYDTTVSVNENGGTVQIAIEKMVPRIARRASTLRLPMALPSRAPTIRLPVAR